MLPPPDTKHDWKFDSTRNAWFYMVNGNQRVYYSSTPRNLPPPVAGPAGRQFQPDNVVLNYKHASSGTGSLPIPIRSGPTAQFGRGPIASPNFAGSPQPVPATGFPPNSQSPGAGIFQRQNSLGAPSVSGASPPANSPPHIAGGVGGFSPLSTTLRKVFEQGGGYVPPQPNPPPEGGGRGGGRPGQGGGNRPTPNQFPTGGGRGGGGSGQGRGPGRGGGSSRGGGGSGRGGSGPARGGGFQPPPNVTSSSSRVTEEQQEILDQQYQVRKRPTKFFRLGKVFLVVHTESFGSRPEAKKAQATAYTSNPDAFVVAFGELAISKVRRFIVVSEQARSCLALAITTHSGSGAAKKNASGHGIVYTGFEPQPLKNEGVMLATPIRVDPFSVRDMLHAASRIDYSKTYNIEHNVKVKPYGMVNQQHMHHLVRQWTQIIMGRFNPAQNAFIAPSLPALRALGFTQGMIQAVLNMMNRPRGPSADVQTSITSVARSSAQFELQVEAEEDASEEQKLALKSEAEKLANHVVEFIMAGMTYHQAVDRVRQLSENGNGQGTENAAVGDIDDDDDDEEEEEADDD